MPPDGITVAGKSPPEIDELEHALSQGLNNIELYLERTHLSEPDETVELLENSDVTVVSVHTPHVPIDEPEWLRRADEIADALDSYLVVHSSRIIHTFIPELEQLDFVSDYGYENNPGISERHIQNVILNQGHEFVLDTAHLYMAEEEYISITEKLLQEFSERIRYIHLCDSSLTRDGLGFGEGSMDMATLSRVVGQHFDGTVVLEVMPDVQAEARDRLQTYWEDLA